MLENVRGTAWCVTNILRNLKRKMWGSWHIMSEKGGGRVPHLIAPMGGLINVKFWRLKWRTRES